MPKSMNAKLHIAMFPWLALGHMIPFLHLANALAKRGHKISFLLAKGAHLKLAGANLHPELLTFFTLSVPHVEGLPPGAETTSDTTDAGVLSLAMDGMQDQVKAILEAEKPNFVFFDFANWIPELALEVGCKTLYFSVISPTISAITLVTSRGNPSTAADVLELLPKYHRLKKVVLREHEAQAALLFANQQGNKLQKFYERGVFGARHCDVLAVRTCKEIEGPYCDYLAAQHGKPVYCTGPLLPEPREEPLDDSIRSWLEKFEPGTVVFCAVGSEFEFEISQFQELVLGLELTGLPFLVAVSKPPKGTASIQEALPDGFQERARDNYMLQLGWVPQTLILRHRSVGFFVSHGGSSSMWESLMSDCQIVLIVPNRRDYVLNTRLMAEELELALEVEKDGNGWFSKESLSKAIKSIKDEDSQLGRLLKENHKKWRDVLLSPGFMDIYIDNFIQKLYEVLGE